MWILESWTFRFILIAVIIGTIVFIKIKQSRE